MFGFLKEKYASISMDEAAEILKSDKSIELIDVRSEEEYAEGHIKNSKNIPLDKMFIIDNKVPNKEAKLFVYCLSGARSRSACKYLVDNGYTNVTNIGGISSWNGPIEH